MQMYVGNQWAMSMANNLTINKRSKLNDIQYHMTRDYDDSAIIKLKKISTEHNTSDMHLMKSKHRYSTNKPLPDKEVIHY